MKRRLWVPLMAVGLAALILVPTTFAVGEPGTTLYAQLGPNRFPGGQGSADASLTFNSQNDIVLRIAITGPAGTVNAVRIYVDGTCTNPGEWAINRTPNAGFNGPFLTVNSNTGVNTIQVNQFDVDRVRSELAENPNETFALMVARLINGQNYRTCTSFRATPFPPLTTTTTTPTQTTQTGTNTTRFTTRTVTSTIGSQTFTFTVTEPVTTTTTATTTRSVTTVTQTGIPTTITSLGLTTSTGFSTGSTVSVGTGTTTVTSTLVTGTQTVTTVFGTGTTFTVTVPNTTVPTTTVTNTITNVTTFTPITTSTFTL